MIKVFAPYVEANDQGGYTKDLKLPSVKDDRYRYSNLLKIYNPDIEGTLNASSSFSTSRKAMIVGQEIPREEVAMLDTTALKSYNPFVLLTLGVNREISYISLKDESFSIDKKIEGFSSSALVIDVEGRCEILEQSSGQGYSIHSIIVRVKSGSNLKYTKIQELQKSSVVDNIHILLEEESRLDMMTLSHDSELLRNNLTVVQEKDSKSSIKGIYKANRHIDTFLRVEHLGSSVSEQKYKGIVEGRASFVGSIYIPPGSKSSSHQLNKNLLISGEVNSKPELEIEHDDVACSHGATIGGIREEELFYFMTRGISKKEAEQILIESFLKDIASEHPEVLKLI